MIRESQVVCPSDMIAIGDSILKLDSQLGGVLYEEPAQKACEARSP
jgi:hypothetical protein